MNRLAFGFLDQLHTDRSTHGEVSETILWQSMHRTLGSSLLRLSSAPRTQAGHEACLSFCHGHYCCFERDPAFGSCVGELNSYCFAYAACENVLGDFEMNNVALGRPGGDALEANNEPLNAQDVAMARALEMSHIND